MLTEHSDWAWTWRSNKKPSDDANDTAGRTGSKKKWSDSKSMLEVEPRKSTDRAYPQKKWAKMITTFSWFTELRKMAGKAKLIHIDPMKHLQWSYEFSEKLEGSDFIQTPYTEPCAAFNLPSYLQVHQHPLLCKNGGSPATPTFLLILSTEQPSNVLSILSILPCPLSFSSRYPLYLNVTYL